jgi:hypothetical protein
MKRRSKDEWFTLFDEHKTSGLSASAFCRERGLNAQYFGKRRMQLLDKKDTHSTSSFVPVAVTRRSTACMVELQLNKTLKLKIPLSVSPTWLVELIQQLQA